MKRERERRRGTQRGWKKRGAERREEKRLLPHTQAAPSEVRDEGMYSSCPYPHGFTFETLAEWRLAKDSNPILRGRERDAQREEKEKKKERTGTDRTNEDEERNLPCLERQSSVVARQLYGAGSFYRSAFLPLFSLIFSASLFSFFFSSFSRRPPLYTRSYLRLGGDPCRMRLLR